jgi:hypothetical protein
MPCTPSWREGLAHLVELERLDDGHDHFHSTNLSIFDV